MRAIDTAYTLSSEYLQSLIESILESQRFRALTDPGLAIGSSSKKEVLVGANTTYLYDGVFKSFTSAEVAFTATEHDIPADASTAQQRLYVIGVDDAGSEIVVPGAVADSGSALLPEWSELVDSDGNRITPFGVVDITVDAGATPFNATTDDLDASHLTVEYTDYGYIFPKFGEAQ